ncbi:hypothetical protein P8605_29790 [Streptomyces sp. T-3]|nr:hypothetical protein [Streptomyces sp. T-3]
MTGERRQLLRGPDVFTGDIPDAGLCADPHTSAELFTERLPYAVRSGVRLSHAVRSAVREPHAMTVAAADAHCAWRRQPLWP